MTNLPKMCPRCGHRCLAPTATLGDISCDHCKALANSVELLKAAKGLLPHIWEDNFGMDVESDFERAVVALKQAIVGMGRE